jgi:hypothetical protein
MVHLNAMATVSEQHEYRRIVYLLFGIPCAQREIPSYICGFCELSVFSEAVSC